MRLWAGVLMLVLLGCGPAWIAYPKDHPSSEGYAEREAWSTLKRADFHLLTDGFHHPYASDCDWSSRHRECDKHFKSMCDQCPPTGQVCRSKEDKFLAAHPGLAGEDAKEKLIEAQLRLRVSRYLQTVNRTSNSVGPYGLSSFSEEAAEIHGYYEHGDRAAEPIRELLTKNQVRYENWSIVSLRLGKDEEKDRSERLGYPIKRIGEVGLRLDLILIDREKGAVRENRKREITMTWILDESQWADRGWKIQGRARP